MHRPSHRARHRTPRCRALRRSTERQSFQLELADRLRPLTSPDELTRTVLSTLGEKLRIATGHLRGSERSERNPSSSGIGCAAAGKNLPGDPLRLDEFGPLAPISTAAKLLARHDIDERHHRPPRICSRASSTSSRNFSEGARAGRRFTVALPLLQLHGTADAPPPATTPRVAVHHLDVLVVDDNGGPTETLKLLLEDAGHGVRVAHHRAHALEQAAAHPPRAAFIDMGLPAMDGYELVQRLRSSPVTAGAVYVALKGYGQEADRGKALRTGFDEHMVKPAEPQRLLSLLDRVPPG